jgi:hypothetical protein
MVDRALADELRAACTAVALDLGGWDIKTNRKTENPSDPDGSVWHSIRSSRGDAARADVRFCFLTLAILLG